MSQSHAEGWHLTFPREGCPDCDGRDLSSYPPFAHGDIVMFDSGGLATIVRCKRDRVGWDCLVRRRTDGDLLWIGAGRLTFARKGGDA